MRKWINLITESQALAESVEFHPSEMTKEIIDGEERMFITYAGGGIRREMRPCFLCAKRGESPKGCGYCKGTGEAMEEVVNCPTMRVGYMEMNTLRQIVGTGDPDHGWVPPEDVPALKQRLEALIAGDTSHLTRPATDEQNPAQLNWDGSMSGGGARMIGGPITQHGLDAGMQRMVEIIDWALEHKTGLSWA